MVVARDRCRAAVPDSGEPSGTPRSCRQFHHLVPNGPRCAVGCRCTTCRASRWQPCKLRSIALRVLPLCAVRAPCAPCCSSSRARSVISASKSSRLARATAPHRARTPLWRLQGQVAADGGDARRSASKRMPPRSTERVAACAPAREPGPVRSCDVRAERWTTTGSIRRDRSRKPNSRISSGDFDLALIIDAESRALRRETGDAAVAKREVTSPSTPRPASRSRRFTVVTHAA